MALEWIKEQADKVLKAAGDAGTALTHEVQSLENKLIGSNTDSKAASDDASKALTHEAQAVQTKTAEPKAAEPKDAAAELKIAATESKVTEPKAQPLAPATPFYLPRLTGLSALSADQNMLQYAALKAELKSQGLSSNPIPKYDGSVLDTVAGFAGKTAAITSSTAVGSFLGYLSAGISAGVTLGSELVKVAENIYQTADKKLTLTVNKIVGSAAAELKEEYHKLFDDSSTAQTKPNSEKTPGSLEFNNIFDNVKNSDGTISRVSSVDDNKGISNDMMHWLFAENEKPQNVAASDNLFSFKNDKQEQTDISAEPGHLHIEKKDEQGHVRTVVDKADGKTIVLHEHESVVIKDGKEVVQGDGYKVSWDDQGKRHITLDSGSELIRDGNEVKVIDKTGGKIVVHPHELDAVDSGIAMIDSPDLLEKITQDKIKALRPGEATMIAIKDVGTRTIFADGTTFDVQNNQARLETSDHKVIQLEVKDNQLFIRRDGQLLPFESSENTFVKAENGMFRIGGLLIDPKKLCIETAPAASPGSAGDQDKLQHILYHLDLANSIQRLQDTHGHDWLARLDEHNSTTVEDLLHHKIVENNHSDSTVTVTTTPAPADANAPAGTKPPPETIKIDLANTNLELNHKIIDDPNKTVIKDTNTVIDKDRTVHLGGEDGPTVKPDGSVRVDKDTYVDKDMTVHSKDWTSYAASKDAGTNSGSTANAQSAAINISSKASSVSGMAKSGKVRWTEVAQLNNALGDVLNLMGSVPTDSPAYTMLLNSYGLLVAAIDDATPKAVATEGAIEKGITSPTAIKALEEGASEEDLRKKRLVA